MVCRALAQHSALFGLGIVLATASLSVAVACDDEGVQVCSSCRTDDEPEPIVIFGPESEPGTFAPDFEPDFGPDFEPDFFPGTEFIGWPTVDGPIVDGPCVAACEGIDVSEGTAEQAARCYSCQCKRAFDDWLPLEEQIQCGAGESVPHYTREGGTLEQIPIGETRAECANPSLFQDDCIEGARYGRVVNGDVDVRFLCRQYNTPATLPYSLVGVIGQNTRTGATCFWDAASDTIGDDGFPALDLSEADETEVQEFVNKIGVLGGIGCFDCHGADPFVYTPFLQGVDAPSGPWVLGPYSEVVLNNTHRAIPNRQLVSPEVQTCTGCHRIAEGLGCAMFTLDAVGGLPMASKEVQEFPHDRWMPHDFAGIEDERAWNDIYGVARDHLETCCPIDGISTDASCQWAPIPTQ